MDGYNTALVCCSDKFSYARCSVNMHVDSLWDLFSPVKFYLFISLSRVCQHHTLLPLTPALLISALTTAPSRHQSHTMSGCAVGPDGKLLDAKDIKWYEDVDSSEPINHTTAPSEFITTANSANTIHPFFRGGPAPAVVAAGSRRSGRAPRPSNRITDPDNAEASSFATAHRLKAPTTGPDNAKASTTHKRKASRSTAAGDSAGRRINRKVGVDDEESTSGSEISDYEPGVAEHPATSDIEAGDTEPDEEPELAYASTKAMGDADREVSLFSPL